MATPLRFDMTLPNGQPLCWDTPGATWDGTVEQVMAAIGQVQNICDLAPKFQLRNFCPIEPLKIAQPFMAGFSVGQHHQSRQGLGKYLWRLSQH
jgi:hypothetical protein